MKPTPNAITIYVRGGLIQGVAATDPNISVVVVDYDTEDADTGLPSIGSESVARFSDVCYENHSDEPDVLTAIALAHTDELTALAMVNAAMSARSEPNDHG
jgi:hypothetical protein